MGKTKIEVICGFLESGKTTLMQHILENDLMEKYNKIVVIQCEQGLEELKAKPLKNKNIVQADIENEFQICGRLFSKIKRELSPDLILIEYNGTWPIENLLRTRLPSDYYIDNILFCADASTFDLYIKNTGEMMSEQLNNSDAVLFNRCTGKQGNIKLSVRNINRDAKLYLDEISADSYLYDILKKTDITERQARHWKRAAGLVLILFCLYLIMIKIPNTTTAYLFAQRVNTVFIGVLLQAVPFLLIGVFVSSILQIFVTDNKLVRLFTKHPLLGFPLAVLMGVLFPVCDCAMAPITARLVKKGVPLPQAITFMLASPVVNPVVFLSTLYAFPTQREFAVYRLLLGVIISLVVGLILLLLNIKADDVLTGGFVGPGCANGYLGSMNYKGLPGKVEAVFRHAGLEFLNVGRFIVCGALVSSILQVAIPASTLKGVGQSIILPLLIMLIASFLMSVCSNSNAFIGKTFLNTFPIPAVMGFIVMGPMLDLKNLFMLSGFFQKNFVLKLTGILFTVGFSVFLLFSFFIRTQ